MHVTNVIPYISVAAGGPSVAVHNLVQQTGKYGWDGSILTSDMYYDNQEADIRNFLLEDIPVNLIKASRWLPLGTSERKLLEQAIQKADVVHVHTLWTPMTAHTRLICEKHGIPYVLMPHGMLSPYSMRIKRLRKLLYYTLVERQNVGRAQRLIYTSDREKELAEDNLSQLPRGVVVPLGGHNEMNQDRARLAKTFTDRFPSVAGRRILLFVGRLHYVKGLDRMLEVLPKILKKHPDVLLVVVGEGKDSYVRSLRQAAERSRVAGSVLFTGALSGEAKWAAYASASMFILLSRHENFGIVVAEAMQMGLPVVITDKVGAASYVEKSSAGIVLGEDEVREELCDVVGELLEEPAVRAEMGQKGKEMASREFAWEVVASRMTACYEEVYREWNR